MQYEAPEETAAPIRAARSEEETTTIAPAFEPTKDLYDGPEITEAPETTETTEDPEDTEEPRKPDKLYAYYDVPLDDELQEYAQDLCTFYEFPYYNVIVAMIGRESSYTEKIISATNDYGYMQINACNHQRLREELGISDLLDGRQNIHGGIFMLQKLYHKYGDIYLALMAYNLGEAGANAFWAQGIYSTAYSRSIMQDADALTIRTS